MRIKVLKDLPGHNAGRSIEIRDDNGIPVDKFWRDRLKDAKIDKCVEIVKPTKKKGDK